MHPPCGGHGQEDRGLTLRLCPLSLSAWLGAFEHPVVDQINQRIQDVTGLDVSTAEDLQVTEIHLTG